MPSNYRLPLQNFENTPRESLKAKKLENLEREQYTQNPVFKKNVKKLRFVPLLSLVLVFALIGSGVYFFNKESQNPKIAGVSLVKIEETKIDGKDGLKIANCNYFITSLDVQEVLWSSQKTDICETNNTLTLSYKSKEGSIKIVSKESKLATDIYLSTNLKNLELSNIALLINPLLTQNNELIKTDSLVQLTGLADKNQDWYLQNTTNTTKDTNTTQKCYNKKSKPEIPCNLFKKNNREFFELILEDVLASIRSKQDFESLTFKSINENNITLESEHMVDKKENQKKLWIIDIKLKTASEITQ
jgi:hypothetical protein